MRVIRPRAVAGWATVLTLAATSLIATPAALAGEADGKAPFTSADLVDSSPTQQGWLSAPESRLTLNPGNPRYPGKKGPTIPLSTEYFAYGNEAYVDPLMTIFRADKEAPQAADPGDGGGEVTEGFVEDFSDITTNGWTADNVDLEGVSGRARVTTKGDWGKITSRPITVNLSETSMLTINVAQAPAGANSGAWALKIEPPTGGDRMVQPDTTQTGQFTYDLSKIEATSGLTGEQTFSVYLFVSGGPAKTIDFDEFRFWGREGASDPEQGQEIVLADEFDDATKDVWVAPPSGHNGATYATDGTNGSVSMPASFGWGSMARTVKVDVDEASALSLWVAETSGKWAIKVQRPGEGEIDLQHDTDATGVFTFDLQGETGWSGEQEFLIRLYQVGAGTSTTFERLSLHTATSWLEEAEVYTSTWRPESIDYTVGYGQNGTAEGFDVPVGTDALGRVVSSDLSRGDMVMGGTYRGGASWDAESSTLRVSTAVGGGTYTWVAALPEGSEVVFFATRRDMQRGVDALAQPMSGQGAWAVVLPGGEAAVGVGYTMGDDEDAVAKATASARSADTPAELEKARAGWRAHWDGFLAQVPVPQDFDLAREGADAAGIDAATTERWYYLAWMGLAANVMQATPETGGEHVQIATGKPSTYASGPKGAEASAAWDSLLGAQFLAQVQPEYAWDAFAGNMKNAVLDPENFGAHEVLPSRAAQTAWILYQVTADKDQLAAHYDALAQYLDWAARPENMRWSFSGKGDTERDAEFYVSMIVDLGHAQKISALLGHDEDAEKWKNAAEVLTADYEEQFFPRDADGNITATLYKHWTDGSHPDEVGLTQYVATGLHVPGLSEDVRDALLARFDSAFGVDKMLAGLADDDPSALKAPDAQFIAYGLLDQGRTEEAAQFLAVVARDIIRAGVFAEVYEVTPDGPRGTSVAPSIFGNINLIDNVWLLNGFRMDQGYPAFVRLPDTMGGISGLTFLDRTFDMDVDGQHVALSGDAAGSATCDRLEAPVGETVYWSEKCGSTDPTDPSEPGDVVGPVISLSVRSVTPGSVLRR